MYAAAVVTVIEDVSSSLVMPKIALRWLLTTTDLILKWVQPSHEWCRARKALWLIICQRAGCQLYMKNSQKCVETVFFSQHCPRKYFLVNTRVFICAVLQHQHSGEDPRSNGQVVLEISPTNDSEKKKLVGDDSNPGRGVFSTFLMTTWCTSSMRHIRRRAIFWHTEWTCSGQNLESGSCAIRAKLNAVLWLPRGTCSFDKTTNLIELVSHHGL